MGFKLGLGIGILIVSIIIFFVVYFLLLKKADPNNPLDSKWYTGTGILLILPVLTISIETFLAYKGASTGLSQMAAELENENKKRDDIAIRTMQVNQPGIQYGPPVAPVPAPAPIVPPANQQ